MRNQLKAILLLCAPLVASAQAPTWEELQSRGAVVSEIRVEIGEVFDLSDPGQNNWIGRVADKLHVDTRESVVRRALLFKAGDRVDARVIHETERELRAFRFVKDAEIVAEPKPDGSAVAVVKVRDAWTLKLSASYSQVGGRHAWGFGLSDQNFLGSGKGLNLKREVDSERTSNAIIYDDHQLFGSRWSLSTTYQSLSDGRARAFDIQRPFFALDTPWSAEIGAASTESRLLIYDHNDQIFEAPSKVDSAQVGAGWAAKLDGSSVLRLGIGVELQDARYGALTVDSDPGELPPPQLAERRLRGPAFSLEWLRDGFRTFRDLQGMDIAEDYNLGWSGDLTIGLYTRAWGSTETAPFLRMDAAKGWAPSDRSLLLFQSYGSARRASDGIENGLAGLSLSAYASVSPHQLLAGFLAVDGAQRPDPEKLLYLGGTEGLRGYTDHAHIGDQRWIASIEERLLTDWRWLGILRAGFVVYADAGAIRQLDGLGWSRTYADIGGGLRFGDLKSSLGRVVYITMAYPLVKEPGQDKWQLVVGNTVRF